MHDQATPQYELVRDEDGLGRTARLLAREKVIGVDLEADSMFHYQEKICLLQISTRHRNFLVDPLEIEDMEPLRAVLEDAGVVKVFHGSDYDIRSLYRDYGFGVHNLFDTEVAARFLGETRTGLAGILESRLGVVLEKKYQKKDWSKRPLPDEMLAYAVHDSCHLIALKGCLERELSRLGRLEWVREECEHLSRVRPPEEDGSPLFLRFRGAGKLDRRGLAVLEALLRFRVKEAQRLDRPPFKVLGSGTIKALAEKRPMDRKGLKGIEGLSPKLIRAFGDALLREIQKAMAMEEGGLPVYPRRSSQRLTRREKARVQALKAWRSEKAATLGVDPAVVCSNTLAFSLARACPATPRELDGVDDLRAWQRRAFGREICAVLSSCT